MFDAFLFGFGGGFLAWVLFSGFQQLAVFRIAKGLKDVQGAVLSDTRRASANKRWDKNAELEELSQAVRTNRFGVNQPETDKWGNMLERG